MKTQWDDKALQHQVTNSNISSRGSQMDDLTDGKKECMVNEDRYHV